MSYIFILVGPSAVGKSELLKRAIARMPRLVNPVSHTTRMQRPKEVAGIDYLFITHDWFESKRFAGEFCEVITYDGEHYGYERRRMDEALEHNDVLLVTGEDGAEQLKAAYPGRTVRIFVVPPNESVLRQRMEQRGDDEATITRRLAVVAKEVERHYEGKCDALIFPEDIEAMYEALETLIDRKRKAVW